MDEPTGLGRESRPARIPHSQRGPADGSVSLTAPARRLIMIGTVHLDTAAGRSGRTQGPGRGLFARLGRTVTAHPGKVALGWLLVVAALMGISGVLGQPPPPSSVAGQLPAGYESARAQAAMDTAFGAPSTNATAVLVISRADGRALTAGNLAAAGH